MPGSGTTGSRDLRALDARFPWECLAFALGGIALIGVPPSGAYLAKTLLLQATSETAQWWWDVVIQAGGAFTSSYVLLMLFHALMPAAEPATLQVRISRFGEATALLLALCSLLLGLVPWQPYLPVPEEAASSFTLYALASSLWPIPAGAVLAILMGRGALPLAALPSVVVIISPARRAAHAFARVFVRIDGTLRQWPAAALTLLAVAFMFGVAMVTGR